MADDPSNSIVAFIDSVRSQTAGTHIVIAPCYYSWEDGLADVQAVAAARHPGHDYPCVLIARRFKPPESIGQASRLCTWRVDQAIQGYVATRMKRMFATVEICSNRLDFVRAVERNWPCVPTAIARERAEVNQRIWLSSESRRRQVAFQR